MINWDESGPNAADTAPTPDQQPTQEVDVASTHSKRSPAFQFYPESWLSSSKVRRMSYTEKGIYTDLLAHCWLDQGLPANLQQIAALLKIPTRRFVALWERGALKECFVERGGRLHNQRLDAERKKQAEFRKQKQDAAHMRWISGRGAARNADAMPSISVSVSDSISEKRERRATLIQPRRPYAAWEGAKGIYVPQRKHADFVALRNHPDAENELLAWYVAVVEAWPEGRSPGADMMRFWTDRFNEKWPAPVTASKSSMPAWAQKAKGLV